MVEPISEKLILTSIFLKKLKVCNSDIKKDNILSIPYLCNLHLIHININFYDPLKKIKIRYIAHFIFFYIYYFFIFEKKLQASKIFFNFYGLKCP